MKKAPATWITLEASQALTEWMATLHQGIVHAAGAKNSHKNASPCIELSDILHAMPVACQAWLESVHDHVTRKPHGKGKVA